MDTNPELQDRPMGPSSCSHNIATIPSNRTFKATVHRSPRSAGFNTKNAKFTEWLEFSNARNFRTLYEALRGDPPDQNGCCDKPLDEAFQQYNTNPLNVDPSVRRRKRLLDALFRARAKGRPAMPRQSKILELNEKAGLALQRTSNGHTYGQIVPIEFYEGISNDSTYQVNTHKLNLESLADCRGQKPDVPAKDFKNGISSDYSPMQEPMNGALPQRTHGHKGLAIGVPPIRNTESQTSTTDSREIGFAVHKARKNKVKSVQRRSDLPKLLLEAAPAIPSPIHHTNDSILGLSREFSQILSGGDGSFTSSGADPQPGEEAKWRPNIRDFANHGSSFVKALRARSRSPAKRVSKQRQQQQRAPRNARDQHNIPTLKLPTRECEASPPRKQDSIATDLVTCSDSSPAAPPTTPESVTRQHWYDSRPSPIAETFSKPPSMKLNESVADVISDTSSAIVSNAQSAVIVCPPMPGPAPTTPLPSLPEGHDAPIPLTPHSSRNIANMGYHPPCQSLSGSPGQVPPTSPARYRFTPIGQGWSPPKPKRPASPIRRIAATELEHILTPPSSPTKRDTTSYSRPHQDLLPKSITTRSTSARGADQAQLHMVGSTYLKETKDLDATTGAPISMDAEDLHHGIVELPSICDACEGSMIFARHRVEAPQLSDISHSTGAQLQGESVILSHRLSPIIVIAEQAPTVPIQRTSSQTTISQNRDSVDEYLHIRYPESHTSQNSIDERPQRPMTHDFLPKPAKPASPSLHLPHDESRLRPSSIQSMPVSRPVSLSAQSIPIIKSVAARVPTPFTEPILRGDAHRSSQHSSFHTADDLETRLAARERKIIMLESALMAVIDCSSRYESGSSGMSFREREGSSVVSNDGGRERFSGASG